MDSAFGSAGGRHFLRQSFTKTHSPATFRIMVIGDSVTRGPSLKNATMADWGTTEGKRNTGRMLQPGRSRIWGSPKIHCTSKALDYMPDLLFCKLMIRMNMMMT